MAPKKKVEKVAIKAKPVKTQSVKTKTVEAKPVIKKAILKKEPAKKQIMIKKELVIETEKDSKPDKKIVIKKSVPVGRIQTAEGWKRMMRREKALQKR